jgi:hypothetical protein
MKRIRSPLCLSALRGALRAALRCALLSALPLSLAACSDDEAAVVTTESFATSDISLRCEAEGNGEAILLTVTITKVGNYTSLVLADGDRLLASAVDAAEQPLFLYDTSHYAVLLPTAAPQLTLSFARGAERSSAEVVLPEAFALTVPGGPIPSDDPIPLSWEQGSADNDLSVAVDGACITPFNRALESDTGGYTLQPGDLFFSQAPGGAGSCTFAVSVTRLAPRGSLPLGGGGSLTAAQVRTAALEVTR